MLLSAVSTATASHSHKRQKKSGWLGLPEQPVSASRYAGYWSATFRPLATTHTRPSNRSRLLLVPQPLDNQKRNILPAGSGSITALASLRLKYGQRKVTSKPCVWCAIPSSTVLKPQWYTPQY